LLEGLARVVPLTAAVARGVRNLTLAAGAGAAVIAIALFRHGFPDETEGRVFTTLALAAALAPPVVLTALMLALNELRELPERIMRLPESGRAHTVELGRLAREARATGRPRWRLPVLLWRLGARVASVREDLTPWAPLLPFLSVSFLVAAGVAAAAAALEIAVAVGLLVWLAS
jgi:hypothetical protein